MVDLHQILAGNVITCLEPLLRDREETVTVVRVVNSRFRTSLVLRPMVVAFDLGTRLHVHMRTKLEKGILRNGHSPQSVVNGFY